MATTTSRTDPTLRGGPESALAWGIGSAPSLGTFSILRDGRPTRDWAARRDRPDFAPNDCPIGRRDITGAASTKSAAS